MTSLQRTQLDAVYGVWNDEDYYGPHLVEIWSTRESAETAKTRLNEPYRAQCLSVGVTVAASSCWPHFIQEHEVHSDA